MAEDSTKSKIIEEYGGGIKESFDPELLRAFDVADQEVPAELRKPENVRLSPDKLRLSGDAVFYTIQGEGITMGEPSVFVRLHVCNLRCVWCDAYYTWNPKSKEFWTESKEVTPQELKDLLEGAWTCTNPKKQKRVVITGGEPLLQKQKIDMLIDLMPDWAFEIETNGTIMPTDKQLERVQFNCSPKLENSKNSKQARFRPEVLLTFNKIPNSQFKFVVMTEADVQEVEQDFVEGLGLDINKVILMPQGVTHEEVSANAKMVAEIAKLKGYKLLGRMQVEIWGAKRKV